MKHTIISIVIFILLAVMTHQVHLQIAPQIRGNMNIVEAPPTGILYLPKGEYVKVLALGFDSFMADMIWLRSLQYFGGHFMYDRKYPIIMRLLDVITDLEPRFIDVYSFGAMVLHEEVKDRDHGVEILSKGIKNNPDNWHMPYELGFLWYEEMRESKDSTYQQVAADSAVQAYAIATTKSECPDFVQRIVIQMNDYAGRKALAQELWQRKLEEATAKNDKIAMQIAEDKILLFKFQDVVLPIRQAIADYYKKHDKKIPDSLNDLVKDGLIKRIPPDPLTNEPLMYDNKNGRVWSRLKSQF